MSEPFGFSAQVYICANHEASISAKKSAVFYSAKVFTATQKIQPSVASICLKYWATMGTNKS